MVDVCWEAYALLAFGVEGAKYGAPNRFLTDLVCSGLNAEGKLV
jgi:hypothetical protein